MKLQATSKSAPVETIMVAGIPFTAAELTALVPLLNTDGTIQAKTKSVVLLMEQVKGRLVTKVGENTALAEFKVTLTIERDPVSDEERHACVDRDANGKARKAAQDAQIANDRKILVESVKAETKANMREGVQLGSQLERDAREASIKAETLLAQLAQMRHTVVPTQVG